jgi:hypothetical protein
MNRFQRRRAAALAGRRHHVGYGHRLLAVHAQGALERGKVYQSLIHHDHWCDIYRRRSCNCVPDISIHPLDGGDVITVDVDGSCKKNQVC